MTDQIINLNRARKAKERAEKKRRAAENRIAHGRPKAERQREAAERALKRRRLDAHARPIGDDEGS